MKSGEIVIERLRWLRMKRFPTRKEKFFLTALMMLGPPLDDPSDHPYFHYQWSAAMVSGSPDSKRWRESVSAQSSEAHAQEQKLYQLYADWLPRWRRWMGDLIFGGQYRLLAVDGIGRQWRQWHRDSTRLREMFDSPQ